MDGFYLKPEAYAFNLVSLFRRPVIMRPPFLSDTAGKFMLFPLRKEVIYMADLDKLTNAFDRWNDLIDRRLKDLEVNIKALKGKGGG